MKSIKSLIQELNLLRGTWEFKAMSLVDEHITELESKVRALEARNMRYFCRAYGSAIQVIPVGVATALTLDITAYPQFGNMHSNTVTPTRIWIRRNGVYYIFGTVHLESVAGGTYRELIIALTRGGVTTIIAAHTSPPLAIAEMHLSVATAHYLYEGDYIQLQILHDVAAGIDSEPDGEHSPMLVVSERMEDLDPSQYGLLNPGRNMR